MRKVPWAFCEWWKLGGGGERLCRDWWTSQKSCNVTGRPLRNTRFVIGSMREEPASNRRGLAVLLCVRTCGCLLKEKDYVSASVIGPAARGKPQSEDNHMSVTVGTRWLFSTFTSFEFLTVRAEKKEVSLAVVTAMLPSSVRCALWISPSHAPNLSHNQNIQLFTHL